MTILEETEKVKLVLEGLNNLNSHFDYMSLKFRSEKGQGQTSAWKLWLYKHKYNVQDQIYDINC